MDSVKVKFENRGSSDFFKDLKKRVDSYFKDNNISKRANALMVTKTSIFFLVTVASYALILTNWFSGWSLFLMYLMWGLSSAFFVFSVAHDAAHNAYAESRKVNEWLTYSWNLVGISSYVWKLKHNIAHHSYTNVPGSDQDIDQGALLVLKPDTPKKSYHRYQHLYAPLVYMFYSIYLIYVKDFELYAEHRFGNKVIKKHPRKEFVILILTKLFYFTYSFVIPLIVLSVVWWKVVLMYFGMHFIIGLTMAFILSPVHITEESAYTAPDAEGKIYNCWAKHQIESTIDFGANSALVHWFSGGLNTHIAHHIFPNICHIHYRPITQIIKETAKEHGLRYTNKSVGAAMLGHLKFLRDLGRGKEKERVLQPG